MFTAVSPLLPVFRIVDILVFLWEKEGKNLSGQNTIRYTLHTIASYCWIKHQLSLFPILTKLHLYLEHILAQSVLLTCPLMCQARCWLSKLLSADYRYSWKILTDTFIFLSAGESISKTSEEAGPDSTAGEHNITLIKHLGSTAGFFNFCAFSF